MGQLKVGCSALLLAIVLGVPSPLMAQLLPAFGKAKGLPKISIARDGLPALANPAYGEVMLSGNEALLEPAWLIGSLRDGATGQVLKWNNYLLPDAKPNIKLLTDTVFEGFVDSAATARTEWLSALKLQGVDRTVAEVTVTRVSVTSVGPKQIDRARLLQEIVQKLPPEQQNRYSVVIAYVDIAITATRFQHFEVDGDVAGYGGRIGSEWYYKDKQKTTDHRLVAISAPLQFAVTAFAPQTTFEKGIPEKGVTESRPCYELVSDAIRRGVLPPEKLVSLGVCSFQESSCPIAIASSTTDPKSSTEGRQLAARIAAEKARLALEQQRESVVGTKMKATNQAERFSPIDGSSWRSPRGDGTSASSPPAYEPADQPPPKSSSRLP